MKNTYSKEERGRWGRLLLSLLSYFLQYENACSKQAEGCFLVYLTIKLLLQYELCVFKRSGGCFLVY